MKQNIFNCCPYFLATFEQNTVKPVSVIIFFKHSPVTKHQYSLLANVHFNNKLALGCRQYARLILLCLLTGCLRKVLLSV